MPSLLPILHLPVSGVVDAGPPMVQTLRIIVVVYAGAHISVSSWFLLVDSKPAKHAILEVLESFEILSLDLSPCYD